MEPGAGGEDAAMGRAPLAGAVEMADDEEIGGGQETIAEGLGAASAAEPGGEDMQRALRRPKAIIGLAQEAEGSGRRDGGRDVEAEEMREIAGEEEALF